MASTTFNGPVRSEGGFQMATKNATTGAVTTRMSSGMPDLTGLLLADTATAANISIADGVIAVVNYTGAAACAVALPAATRGAIAVYVQAKIQQAELLLLLLMQQDLTCGLLVL